MRKIFSLIMTTVFCFGLLSVALAQKKENKAASGSPGIPQRVLDYFNFRTGGTGRWITDNSKYKNENEPFDEYVTEWVWGAGKLSIKGRLFGLKEKKETAPFAEFRIHWHPAEQKVVAQVFGATGLYAIGEMQLFATESEIRIEHTAYPLDGGSYRELHKEIDGKKDEFRSESFKLQDGSWQPNRTYIWRRAL